MSNKVRKPTEQEVWAALVARRRAFTKVATFIKTLANERSELGEEARGLVKELQLLQPYTH